MCLHLLQEIRISLLKKKRSFLFTAELDEALAVLDVGVLVCGPEAQVRYSNAAACQLLGLTLEQLLGESAFAPDRNVQRPDGRDFPHSEHPVPQAIATREPVRNVVMGVYRPAFRDRVWLLINAVPSIDADGGLNHVICSFTDISEQRAVEAQLRRANASLEQQLEEQTQDLHRSLSNLTEREQLYRSVFKSLTEGTVVHDTDGAIIDANPSASAVLGLSLDQLQGRTERDPRWRLEELDGRPLQPDLIPSRIAQREGISVRARKLSVCRGSGERALLSVNAEPVFAAAGDPRPSMVVSTFEDITQRHSTQLKLQESNARFQRVSDALPGVVMEWDWQGSAPMMLSFISGAERRLLGLEVGVQEETFLQQVVAEDRDSFQRAIQRARRRQLPIDMRLRLSVSDTLHWYQLRATAVRTEVGGQLHVLLLNIEQQVQMETATRENQRQRLIGEMTAGVAHNFNNMLAVILPNLEDALTQVRGELREQLREAVDATLSAADLVRQLLRFAHNEPAVQHQNIELVSLIKEAFQISRRTFDRQTLMIFSPPPEPCWTFGHRSDLQQVIFNLLLNARDAVASTANPCIELSITQSGSENSGWRIAIIDNGVGISAENIKRIGEPFFTTKGPSQGTGMGLATAMRIAELHGGRLHCHSIEGQGTTFYLDLPRVLPKADTATTEPDAGEAPWMRKVLLIDDEHILGRALTRGLRRSGIELVQAHGGREGIALFSAQHASLSAVLLDLSMPDMFGGTVLQHLQQIDPSVPVLIMSGHIDPMLDLCAASDIMQKPIRISQIAERLQALWSS